MNLFITGAAGYIGGSVAQRLIEQGHQVRGLVRADDKAAALRPIGIEPVLGTLDDLDLLAREARAADGVIDAANSDHAASVDALVAALAGSGKPLIHTSGTSVFGDDARGDRLADHYIDDGEPIRATPAKPHRRAIDLAVLAAADRGVRSVVICPGLIFGFVSRICGRVPAPEAGQARGTERAQ
jgi:nucleoside-diphosphate-sugar epimerase